MYIKNIFKYINCLFLIILCDLSISEIYSCKSNGNIVYTDKHNYSCSKAILPNLIKENVSYKYNNNHLKNNFNELSKLNNQNRYKILINELSNEKIALNKAKQLLNSNTSQNKNKILNEINDRKYNIYLLKKEILKLKGIK